MDVLVQLHYVYQVGLELLEAAFVFSNHFLLGCCEGLELFYSFGVVVYSPLELCVIVFGLLFVQFLTATLFLL